MAIEDELYQLKDENNGLKRRLNDQDDKTKRFQHMEAISKDSIQLFQVTHENPTNE